MLSILNISAYRFIRLPSDFLLEIKDKINKHAQKFDLKGTVLLSPEGINLFLAGKKTAVISFLDLLNQFSYFENLVVKKSFSDFQPFKKMLVKIKKEIIPFGVDTIHPEAHTAPTITPVTLNKWITERTDLVLLDTRNCYEVEMGSFKNSIHLMLKHFRDFHKAIQKLPERSRKSPLITFCTGGIRCEKASEFLLQEGFSEVYQLEGGILNYFEKCGGKHYEGLCFVFDERKALSPSLIKTVDEG